MKQFIAELKAEYSKIITPSFKEVSYISFLVFLVACLISLSIVGFDFFIGSIINSILFN
jgi:preprotein translocase SecE subunit